jgi:hypothetical protein
MAPEFIPGIIKKQMEILGLSSYKNMTPVRAKTFISNIADALTMFIGPEGSRRARLFMMSKLRECCTETEKASLINNL